MSVGLRIKSGAVTNRGISHESKQMYDPLFAGMRVFCLLISTHFILQLHFEN